MFIFIAISFIVIIIILIFLKRELESTRRILRSKELKLRAFRSYQGDSDLNLIKIFKSPPKDTSFIKRISQLEEHEKKLIDDVEYFKTKVSVLNEILDGLE